MALCFSLTPKMTHAIARLDESAADIMRTDNAQLERDARCFGITKRRRGAAVGHRDDIVDIDAIFARQFCADGLANRIDADAFDDRIGSREIDVFENARAVRDRDERLVRGDLAVPNHHQLAGFDRTDELCTDNIERHGFRSENHRIAELAHHQRSDAQRIAAGDHAFGGQAN